MINRGKGQQARSSTTLKALRGKAWGGGLFGL